MSSESNLMDNRQKKAIRGLVPYGITVGGAALTIVADFIRYLTLSSLFFTRKTSLFHLIMECVNYPETALKTTEDKVVLAILLVGVAASLLALIFALAKKMKAVIVFSIILSIPFLLIGDAWVHHIGIILSLIGAIWFLVINRKKIPATD